MIDVEQTTTSLANVRIHVERVIGNLRNKHSILSATQPIDFLTQNDTIWTVPEFSFRWRIHFQTSEVEPLIAAAWIITPHYFTLFWPIAITLCHFLKYINIFCKYLHYDIFALHYLGSETSNISARNSEMSNYFRIFNLPNNFIWINSFNIHVIFHPHYKVTVPLPCAK